MLTRVAPWKSAFARATRPLSSPSSSGTITRCALPYGVASTPSATAIATSCASDKLPTQCSTGISAVSGALAASAISIVRRDPSAASTVPLGIPNNAKPAMPPARTKLICFAEPVLTRTNHGSASELIWLPVVEITSAASRAVSGRFRTEAR
jgi:hypothetical protein